LLSVVTAAMSLVLTPRTAADRGPLSIDLEGLTPARVAPLALTAINRLVICADGRLCELGSLFDVAGDPADAVIECRGDFSHVHRVAAGMTAGTIRVTGDVGRHAAEGMTGGRLDVAGNAGDWLAAELAGGEVFVAGSAGDNLAGALPGSPIGMRGGVVVVAGAAGGLAGARMRRGIVAVGGDCGPAPAFELRAGTVVIGGAVGCQPGLGMRRGSVIALTARPAPPASFRRGAAWRPAFLPLLLKRLADVGFGAPMAAAVMVTAWRQWHGDTLAGGRGELLHPA
jgi:formylmethanofuran dehydrogenase subunit C